MREGPVTCPVCLGGQCCGGGNKRCIQRDPQPSHIAGILDSYGGVRTCVDHKHNLKLSVRYDEFLCVVPDKLVHEPIAWGDIPFVIALAHLAVDNWCDAHERDNDPAIREAITLYRLRKLEQDQESFDPSGIAFT